MKRLTVKLAPADVRKASPAYDLPIAVGLLLAPEQLYGNVDRALFVGELGLDSALRHTDAAGAHNLLMCGPPGAGKTLMARAVPSILPPMELSEALEVTKIYSVSGMLPNDTLLIRLRPFCSPHHTISQAGLVGGGSKIRPGEITRAHRGVLFLDELPEFGQQALEVLRQPLEDRVVTIN